MMLAYIALCACAVVACCDVYSSGTCMFCCIANDAGIIVQVLLLLCVCPVYATPHFVQHSYNDAVHVTMDLCVVMQLG